MAYLWNIQGLYLYLWPTTQPWKEWTTTVRNQQKCQHTHSTKSVKQDRVYAKESDVNEGRDNPLKMTSVQRLGDHLGWLGVYQKCRVGAGAAAFLGLAQVSSAAEGACCQAWGPESNAQGVHSGRQEPFSKSCSLISIHSPHLNK